MGQSNDKFAIPFYKDIIYNSSKHSKLSKPKQQIQLSITLSQTETAEYQYTAYELTETKKQNLLTTSEQSTSLNNNTCTFKALTTLIYHFEEEQPLLFKITKTTVNNATIEMEFRTNLSNIISSRKNKLTQRITSSHDETITIQATETKSTQQYLYFIFDVYANFQLSKQKYKFNYNILNNKGESLYQSETLSSQGTLAPVSIPIDCLDNKFSIQFIDTKNKQLGSFDTTKDEFLNKEGLFKTIMFPFNKKHSILLHNQSLIQQKYSFIDYIHSGIKISLSIAIDFTLSNGAPSNANSLHYINDNNNTLNSYQKAIAACGNILSVYDKEQQFPVYGFGACINNAKQPSMCFAINNINNSPEIHTIQQVLEHYKQIVKSVNFGKKTAEFGSVLKEVIKNVENEVNKLKYTVLLILTNSVMSDLAECVDLLVKGGKLPMSVIIVGIGNGDFGKMEGLGVDENLLVSIQGERCCRDIVQFVKFSKFGYDECKLGKNVLKKIPRQVFEYFSRNNIYPCDIIG